jgi:hypothetical protein
MQRTISGGVYQTPKLLAQLRIVGLKKRLAKVLDGVMLFEAFEECDAIDAVEHRLGPAQCLGEVEGFELAGLGELVEELAQNGDI